MLVNKLKIILTILLTFTLLSCDKHIATINLLTNNGKGIDVSCIKNNSINFIIDADLIYKQPPLMVIDFEFFINDSLLLKGGVNPLEMDKINFNNTKVIDDLYHHKFKGKITGNFTPKKDGVYSIFPRLLYNKDEIHQINKLNLIIVK